RAAGEQPPRQPRLALAADAALAEEAEVHAQGHGGAARPVRAEELPGELVDAGLVAARELPGLAVRMAAELGRSLREQRVLRSVERHLVAGLLDVNPAGHRCLLGPSGPQCGALSARRPAGLV